MFEKLIPIINSAEKVGLFAHTHPDGDAMGSSYAMSLALRSVGKQTKVFLLDCPDVQAHSLVIKGDEPQLRVSDCDLLIALDCADSMRLGKYEKAYLKHKNTIAIDHHITHVPFARSGTFFKEISSTCELIYILLNEMRIPITKEIAANLYIGLVTDTGNFKYSGVTGDTLRTAAALLDTGIDFSAMAKTLFDTKPKSYYNLMRTAINKMKYICDGRAAVLYLSDKDFHTAGIEETAANGVVTIPGSIEGVEVGVYIRERESNEYKVSLRSNSYMDVAAIAAAMGGGGHLHASGYSVYNKTVDEIVKELTEELDKKWRD